jgi:hypothetical protein
LEGTVLSTHEFPDDRSPRAGARRRWLSLGMLSIAALLLHAAAFSGLAWSWPQADSPVLPAPTPTLQVRVVEPAVPAMVAAVLPVTEPALPTPRPRPDRAAATPAAAAAAAPKVIAAPARAVLAKPTSGKAARSTVAEAASVDAAAPPAPMRLALNTSAAAAPPSSATDEDSIPHYRTKMPPALTVRYEMQKGALQGTGDLSWRPQGDRYELKLEARVSGLPVLTQISSGAFDDAGIAPQRFTDKRLARSMTAANFQRGADKITYSGASESFPLRAGAQDRLSWMIQLGAVVAAEPQLSRPGAKVVMFVTGSHGDAGVWSFRCVGPEALSTRSGSVETVKFVREPREANDTTVQVWLAPQQHELPVRATQKSGPSDEGYELRLLEIVPAQ